MVDSFLRHIYVFPQADDMMASSNGNISALLAVCAGNSPVNAPHKGQWRRALMFSLICASTNVWANNRKGGDMRRHCSHYGDIMPQQGSGLPWWRHQVETFSALLAICAGNSQVPGEFPAQRPVTRSFDVFFDLRPNKRLSKHWWGWWFKRQSSPLWHHWNAEMNPCSHPCQTHFVIWFQFVCADIRHYIWIL